MNSLSTSTKLKPIIKHDHNKPLHSISAEDMWNCLNKSSALNGIAGYVTPQIYFDARKIKSDRENFELNLQVWSKKALYPTPLLRNDKDGNPIIPKRKTFIDDEISREKGYFSPEKAEKYQESRGLIPLPKKDPKKSYIYSQDRLTIFQKQVKDCINENKYTENQQERADKVKEKQIGLNIMVEKKHWADVIKAKYSNRTSLSKEPKSAVIGEYEYIGEKCPFYNSDKAKDEEDPKKKHEFFPNINYVKKRYGAPRYYKDTVLKTENFEKKDEIVNEKIDKIKQRWEERKVMFLGNSTENKNKIDNRGRLYFSYKKVS